MSDLKVDGLPAISRGRRCQNCLNFDAGEKTVSYYKQRRFLDMQAKAKKILERDGVTPDPHAPAKAGNMDPQMAMNRIGQNYSYGDELLHQGRLGMCLKGNTKGDFVHADYLCDQWVERVRPDGAEQPDELGDEARDRIYGDDDKN